tara:strand:+ start:2782 stop:6945 length:4164 start_codon:yes stop_codon:yes gene_type:complete
MAVPLDKEQDQRYGVANALGGLTAEIGIAAAGQKASALAAAATASTGVGFAAAPFVYLAGSFGSGYGASIANQSITDPDGSIDYGRAMSAGLINLIPLSQTRRLGKIGVLLNNVNRRMYTDGSKTVAGSIANLAKQGAIFGSTDAAIRSIINEKRLPTVSEFVGGGSMGAVAGGGLAVAGKGAKFAYQNMGKLFKEFPQLKQSLGKTPIEIAERSVDEIEQVLAKKYPNEGQLNRALQEKMAEVGSTMDGTETNAFMIGKLQEKARNLGSFVVDEITMEVLPSIHGSTQNPGVAKHFVGKLASALEKFGPSFVIKNKSVIEHLQRLKETSSLWADKSSEFEKSIRFFYDEAKRIEKSDISGSGDLTYVGDTISKLFAPKNEEHYDRIFEEIAGFKKLYAGKYNGRIDDAVNSMSEAALYKEKLQRELFPHLENSIFVASSRYKAGTPEYRAAKDLLEIIKKSEDKGNYYKKTYMLFKDKNLKPTEKMKKDVVDEVLGNPKLRKFYEEGGTEDFRVETAVYRELQGYIDNSAARGGKSLIRGPLMERRTLPKSVKAFLGGELIETSGAGADVIRSTLTSLGTLTNRLNTENSIAKLLIGSNLAKTAPDGAFNVPRNIFSDKHKRNVFIDIMQKSENLKKKFKGKIPITSDDKYDALMLERFEKIGEEAEGLGPLLVKLRSTESAPIYVTQEMSDVLNRGFQQFENAAMDAAMAPFEIVKTGLKDTWKAMSALTKFTKVITSLQTYSTAFMGAAWQGMLNGVRVARDPKGFARAAGFGLSQVGGFTSRFAPEYHKNRMSLYKELGLLPSNVVTSDIMDTLKSGGGRITKMLSDNPGVKVLGRLYSSMDTAMRISVFENNVKLLEKAIPKSTATQTRGKGTTMEFEKMIENAAAIMTNETYNNYGRISQIIKELSQWGLLDPFVAFQTELARTTYNSGKHIYQVIGSNKIGGGNYKKFLTDIGITRSSVDQMTPKQVSILKREFAERAVAFGAIVGVGGYAVPKMWNGMYGTSEEELEDLKTADIPHWDKDKTLIANYDPETKKGFYMNYSYLMPYELMGRIYEVGTNGKPFEDAVNFMKSEYLGEGNFVARAAAQSILGKDERGKSISLSANKGEQLLDRTAYFLDQAFTPGISKEAKNWVDKDRDVKVLLQKLVGIRWREIDLEKDASYKVYGANQAAENLSKEYTRVYRSFLNEDISEEQKNKDYEKFNRQRVIQFKEMRDVYDSMINLGYTRDELAKLFNSQYKVSAENVLNLSNNLYKPISEIPTSELSTGKIYQSIPGDTPTEKAKMLYKGREEIANPVLFKRLMMYTRQQEKILRSGVSEEDKLLMSMDSEERVRWLMENRGLRIDNKALINELAGKRVLTRTDMQYLHVFSQNKTAPISGGY